MKKNLIGALVGGLLIFVWQTLSWTVLDLHRPSQDYTPKQDTIMNFLNSQLEKEGGYALPTVPKGTSFEEATKQGEASLGKPYALIQYHKKFDMDSSTMMMNMFRGLVASMFMVWMLCWILSKWSKASFSNIFIACIFTGLIVYISEPYSQFIWYKIFDNRAHLIDALAGWGICGVWLGWWMKK
jgi:hypothetical protein